MPFRLSILDRELVVVTGKGGTGKSAVAAALATLAAGTGRDTLLLESDPRESGHRFLGCPPSAGEIVTVRSGLHFQNVRPAEAVDRLVADRMPSRLLARRVTASAIYQHFVRGAPGLEPLAILGHAAEVLGEGGIDRVVLDAPATGHAVTSLLAAGLVRRTVGGGPVADLAAGVEALVAEPARCAVVVVTLAEEMPVTETLELVERLASGGRVVDGVVANALYPPPARSVEDTLGGLWTRRWESQDRELERLSQGWDGPLVDLALIPRQGGPDLTAALAEGLREAVE